MVGSPPIRRTGENAGIVGIAIILVGTTQPQEEEYFSVCQLLPQAQVGETESAIGSIDVGEILPIFHSRSTSLVSGNGRHVEHRTLPQSDAGLRTQQVGPSRAAVRHVPLPLSDNSHVPIETLLLGRQGVDTQKQ